MPDSINTWTISLIGDADEVLESLDTTELQSAGKHISKFVDLLDSGRLAIYQDVGELNWFHRLVRGGTRDYQHHAFLEWCDGFASLIFVDDAGSEYHAIDPQFDTSLINADTRSKISHGELTPHPAELCLKLERAIQAILSYLDKLERPDWIDYKYVS